MKISKKDWNNYISRLRKINSIAADKVAKHMRTVDINTDEGMKSLLDYSYAVSTAYGEAATELACQMYDAVALVSKANVPPAEPAATATYGEVVRAVKGKMFDTKEPAAIGSAVGRLVKMAGVDTTMQNALRDGAEWAWIPSGDTCAFCLTLASRGWQKASKKAIRGGHAEHIHHNCDCTYAIRFDGKSDVDGYDSDALYDEYINAGDTPQERINALRRQQYAANPEKYRAQKRAAYKARVNGANGERQGVKNIIDNGNTNSYNNSPTDDELRRRYERDVQEGWVSALCGFDNYKGLYNEIEKNAVGITTPAGVVVKSQSEHFLTRVIGTSLNPTRVENGVYKITGIEPQGFRSNTRNGVNTEEIVDALKFGRVRKMKIDENGQKSMKIVGNNCIVTINPDTGNLIQCNPRGGGK